MKPSTILNWERNIQQAISLAHNDPLGNIDLKKVADKLCVSADILSHKFTEICQEPYIRFVNRSRLEAGAGLLRHSGFSIREISERCGYTNSSFTKAFRARFDASPTSFRDMLLLPNEIATLERTKIITSPYDRHMADIFTTDRTEDTRLPNYTLYYNILPRSDDPVRNMVVYMATYSQQLRAITASIATHEAMVITGTLDVVPVTTYGRMMMYVGLLLPNTPQNNMAHLSIQLSFQEAFGLVTRQIPGGHYKKLSVPMSFVAAGLPMYEFINNSCRASHFKMSGNHFFISLTGINECDIFIPWQKRGY
ncbi:helix-turn-helix transcriptional regulator [Chitinophaga sp. MM2321]|uniref:helix-turn-helix transcriptional regulator n=1 Tax=Chitinophaga sp. MM2321 TaxID=3137178 RepID=UPI0032D584A7